MCCYKGFVEKLIAARAIKDPQKRMLAVVAILDQLKRETMRPLETCPASLQYTSQLST